MFKVTADPFVGRLTYFRVVRGSLGGQAHVYNVNRREEERVGNLLAAQGKEAPRKVRFFKSNGEVVDV